jgi:hypothetical protein
MRAVREGLSVECQYYPLSPIAQVIVKSSVGKIEEPSRIGLLPRLRGLIGGADYLA